MGINDEWRKYATPVEEIPPGFVQFGLQSGGFMHVHVDAIAAYGPMLFAVKWELAAYAGVEVKPKDASEMAGDFQGTFLQLRGQSQGERTIVLHGIREIAQMCLTAIRKKSEAQCR